jgi:hypothetical protein
MTDTVTYQNIDLSTWGTLYENWNCYGGDYKDYGIIGNVAVYFGTHTKVSEEPAAFIL